MKFVRARNRTAGLVGLLLGWGAAGGQLNVSSAYTHVAVIVEPREHALLEPVVLNMLQHLSLPVQGHRSVCKCMGQMSVVFDAEMSV